MKHSHPHIMAPASAPHFGFRLSQDDLIGQVVARAMNFGHNPSQVPPPPHCSHPPYMASRFPPGFGEFPPIPMAPPTIAPHPMMPMPIIRDPVMVADMRTSIPAPNYSSCPVIADPRQIHSCGQMHPQGFNQNLQMRRPVDCATQTPERRTHASTAEVAGNKPGRKRSMKEAAAESKRSKANSRRTPSKSPKSRRSQEALQRNNSQSTPLQQRNLPRSRCLYPQQEKPIGNRVPTSRGRRSLSTPRHSTTRKERKHQVPMSTPSGNESIPTPPKAVPISLDHEDAASTALDGGDHMIASTPRPQESLEHALPATPASTPCSPAVPVTASASLLESSTPAIPRKGCSSTAQVEISEPALDQNMSSALEPESPAVSSRRRKSLARGKIPEAGEVVRGGESFEIEKIVDHELNRDYSIRYKIKWLGYPDPSEDTMGREAHIECYLPVVQYWLSLFSPSHSFVDDLQARPGLEGLDDVVLSAVGALVVNFLQGATLRFVGMDDITPKRIYVDLVKKYDWYFLLKRYQNEDEKKKDLKEWNEHMYMFALNNQDVPFVKAINDYDLFHPPIFCDRVQEKTTVECGFSVVAQRNARTFPREGIRNAMCLASSRPETEEPSLLDRILFLMEDDVLYDNKIIKREPDDEPISSFSIVGKSSGPVMRPVSNDAGRLVGGFDMDDMVTSSKNGFVYNSLELDPEPSMSNREASVGSETPDEALVDVGEISDYSACSRVHLNLVRDAFIWQLTAAQPIPKGTFIMPLCGKIVDPSVARNSLITETEAVAFSSFVALPSGGCLDRRVFGDPSRFITHSCDPNCAVKPVGTHVKKLYVYAKLDIEPDDVITVDMFRMFMKANKKYKYKDHLDLVDDRFDHVICNCGTKLCRYVLWKETLPDGPVPLSKSERMKMMTNTEEFAGMVLHRTRKSKSSSAGVRATSLDSA